MTVRYDSVLAFVGEPVRFRTDTLQVAGQDVYPFAIGNPHAVVFVDDVDEVAVDEIGPAIENDAMFPNRTNVEFVQVLDEGGIRVRIWERGVGETPASGTGATRGQPARTGSTARPAVSRLRRNRSSFPDESPV